MLRSLGGVSFYGRLIWWFDAENILIRAPQAGQMVISDQWGWDLPPLPAQVVSA